MINNQKVGLHFSMIIHVYVMMRLLGQVLHIILKTFGLLISIKDRKKTIMNEIFLYLNH